MSTRPHSTPPSSADIGGPGNIPDIPNELDGLGPDDSAGNTRISDYRYHPGIPAPRPPLWMSTREHKGARRPSEYSLYALAIGGVVILLTAIGTSWAGIGAATTAWLFVGFGLWLVAGAITVAWLMDSEAREAARYLRRYRLWMDERFAWNVEQYFSAVRELDATDGPTQGTDGVPAGVRDEAPATDTATTRDYTVHAMRALRQHTFHLPGDGV